MISQIQMTAIIQIMENTAWIMTVLILINMKWEKTDQMEKMLTPTLIWSAPMEEKEKMEMVTVQMAQADLMAPTVQMAQADLMALKVQMVSRKIV